MHAPVMHILLNNTVTIILLISELIDLRVCRGMAYNAA